MVLRRTSVPILVTLGLAAHFYFRPLVPCAMTIPALEGTLRRAVKFFFKLLELKQLTRNTPIGVVVREPSAVNHYFRGVCPPKLGFVGTYGGKTYTIG